MSADDIDACQAWYVLYGASGEQCGPYTKDTILTGGFVDLDTQVWCELLPGWTTARNVPFMAAHLGQPDPDPVRCAPAPLPRPSRAGAAMNALTPIVCTERRPSVACRIGDRQR